MTDKAQKTKQLMTSLEDLRTENPVLWAILCGHNTQLKIGLVTRLTVKMVSAELQTLVRNKLVKNMYNRSYVLDKRGENYEHYSQVSKLAHLIEAQWIAAGDPEAVQRVQGMLSTPARARLDAERKAEKKAQIVPVLTEKQQKVIDDIRGWLEDQVSLGRREDQGPTGGPFTTLEAAKAQGYSKPGFTKNVLLALVKKGVLRDLEGRPQKWELTE